MPYGSEQVARHSLVVPVLARIVQRLVAQSSLYASFSPFCVTNIRRCTGGATVAHRAYCSAQPMPVFELNASPTNIYFLHLCSGPVVLRVACGVRHAFVANLFGVAAASHGTSKTLIRTSGRPRRRTFSFTSSRCWR